MSLMKCKNRRKREETQKTNKNQNQKIYSRGGQNIKRKNSEQGAGTMENNKTILNDNNKPENCMYQVSTLQALALGYLRPVVTAEELLAHGDAGLGTFEDLDGEMIVIDGHCYRAVSDGDVYEADLNVGIPFAVAGKLCGARSWDWGGFDSLDELVSQLNNKIEEDFGLNSMHIVRIDGMFDCVDARSELPSRKSQHVALKDLLAETQYSFRFENIKGSLICVYFPNYMDGINLPGWHLHFVSEDRRKGGHVFDVKIRDCHVRMDKLSRIEIQLPTEANFDTYDLKSASQKDVEDVEQGKK